MKIEIIEYLEFYDNDNRKVIGWTEDTDTHVRVFSYLDNNEINRRSLQLDIQHKHILSRQELIVKE